DHVRAQLHLRHLAPLAALLPEPLALALASGSSARRLLIIPVGTLWLVPWSAVPVGRDRLLGEATPYLGCPSLTVHRQLAARSDPPDQPPWPVDVWRSPTVDGHPLTIFDGDPRWHPRPVPTAQHARELLRAGRAAMVVIGHGRPVPGLGLYLELDRDEW